LTDNECNERLIIDLIFFVKARAGGKVSEKNKGPDDRRPTDDIIMTRNEEEAGTYNEDAERKGRKRGTYSLDMWRKLLQQ
jgi:hypothetical protein